MSSHTSLSLPFHLNIRVCIAVLLALVAAGIGGWGMWLYETQHHAHADGWSVAYHTLQLFILHAPHLEHPANWQVHVGRWLSAIVVFWALISAFYGLFRSEFRLFWTRIQGGHVIICGLGRLGQQLATEFRRAGKRVVVIEAQADTIKALRANVAAINGDASNAQRLRFAGIRRARQLIAVCDDVQTNIAIATMAGEVLRRSSSRGFMRGNLECWLFVPDAELRQLLKRDKLFPHTNQRFRVNVRGLDLFSLAARQVLTGHPLDYQPINATSSKSVRFVIVGFGPMGQRLALQAAQVGHYANRIKTKITVLEPAGSPRVASFLQRHPQIGTVTELSTREFSVASATAVSLILESCGSEPDEMLTVALCWDSIDEGAINEAQLIRQLEREDSTNLKLALGLNQLPECRNLRTLLFQTRRSGFANLFPAGGSPSSIGSNVFPFGSIEETCSLETLMHESSDAVARELHQDWYDSNIKAGKKHGDKPALWPWDQLDEVYKESNRHAADHIPAKLRAIGCRVEKLGFTGKQLSTIDDPTQIELLAQMEHARWSAELFIMNYKHSPGVRNDVAKTHPDLVEWELLSESTKNYDRNQVKKIPAALQKTGFGIFKI